ncbi:phosphoribosylanthranilate isomerase [Rhodopila sp.]|uniref:phosphoribosylanthranilate isomerase n=1 Tax=Rhodopila sp. TaxID=2480087 RepID=UPI003D113ECD
MTKVKICGINDAAAFDAAVGAGADWVGFNFFPASPRFISPQTAATLSRRAAAGPPRVGLFVEPSDALLASVLDFLRLDILQIYGRLNDIASLKAKFGLPIWRPVGVAAPADLPVDPSSADALLIEAKPPAEATRPGGNAILVDWPILRGWIAPAPWLLAGGLTPNNVRTAIQLTGADAVDVSSGVERTTGVKDPDLIRAFIQQAKHASTCSEADQPE